MPLFAKASGFADFIYRHSRIVHTAKLALALFIAAAINAIWSLPHFVWSMVTIVIIMMGLPQVGGAIEKSLQRAVGTCLGSAYGVSLVILMNGYWDLMGLLILGVSIVCYLNAGRYSYAYLVAGFTMIIVIGDANHDTSEALWRTANILIGCVIAVLVSLFVLPIKAKQDWRAQLANSLQIMTQVLEQHLNAGQEEPQNARKSLETAMKAVLAQKKLLFSLEWESQTLKKEAQTLTELANKQIRVITLLELLLLTRWKAEEDAAYARVKQVASGLQREFAYLADYVAGNTADCPKLPLGLGYQLQQQLLKQLPSEPSDDSPEAAHQDFALSGYSWLIYQLAQALLAIHGELASLDLAYKRKASSQRQLDIPD
ncbi:FUSC family protein [Shewanella carassii]|uniref:FUSC family protein n=1 Tax=Shewanella carassii TaxID=1987584 RepID=UPI001BEE1766|nr:FUSC family protein [Shewanella carassii]BCV65968.1 FUSC family protein [Shewanella carassii]